MADIQRGRRELLTAIGMLTLPLVLSWVNASRHAPRTGRTVVTVLTAIWVGLCFLAYRRVYWARGALVVWIGIGAALTALTALMLIRLSLTFGVVQLVLASVAGYGAYYLYNSEHIEAYLLADRV